MALMFNFLSLLCEWKHPCKSKARLHHGVGASQPVLPGGGQNMTWGLQGPPLGIPWSHADAGRH